MDLLSVGCSWFGVPCRCVFFSVFRWLMILRRSLTRLLLAFSKLLCLIFAKVDAVDFVLVWLTRRWAWSCRLLCLCCLLCSVAERAERSPSPSAFAGVAVIKASDIALDWREGRGSTLVDVEDLDRARGAYVDRLDSECVDVLGIDPLDSLVKVGVFCLFCFRLVWRGLRLLCSSASCMVAPFSAVPRRIVLRACSPRFAVSRASSRTWVRFLVCCLARLRASWFVFEGCHCGSTRSLLNEVVSLCHVFFRLGSRFDMFDIVRSFRCDL